MKKTRFFLMTIAVLAIVGGALAFKAKNYGSELICTTAGGTACSVSVTAFTENGVLQNYYTGDDADVCDKDTQCNDRGAILLD